MKYIDTIIKGVLIICTLLINLDSVVAQSQPSGWLYTSGNRIYISDGDGNNGNDEVFAGRGANIFDSRSCGAGLWYKSVDEVKRRIDLLVDDWGANFMRLCLESRGEPYDPAWVNYLPFTKDNTGYLDEIVEIVEYIGTKPGVYVEVSLWGEPSNTDGGVPTAKTNEEWKILAPALDKYKHVMFGICNEPHITNDPLVHAAMESAVEEIRKIEATTSYPQHIIAVQGTRDYARDISYYVNNPVSGGVNIVYETHPYDHDFGERFFNEQKTIPVLIGEFGPMVKNGYLYQTLEECQQLMDTCDALKIPYAAWSFHMRCDPSLLVDNSGGGIGINMELEPTEWGELIRDHLQGYGKPKIKNFIVQPSSILNDVENNILVSANVTETDYPLSSVTLDLSDLGLGSSLPMNKNGNVYSYAFTLNAGTDAGKKKISISASDQSGQVRIKSTELGIIAPAKDALIIYNDKINLVTSSWNSGGTLTESTANPNEGSKHYQFNYSLADWWNGQVWGSNFGLGLENNGTGIDFSGYAFIQMAVNVSSDVNLVVSLGNGNKKYSNNVEIEGINSNYQIITIDLGEFTGVDMTNIKEIKLEVGSTKYSSGKLNVDNIMLLPIVLGLEDELAKSMSKLGQNYPNPFNNATTIEFYAPYTGHYSLKIFNSNGQEIASLIDEKLTSGEYAVDWNRKNYSDNYVGSGIYLYQLICEPETRGAGFKEIKKMVVNN